jgi:hypothetical protein
MVMLYAISFICGESITEGLILRHCPAVSDVLFLWWVHWLIAIGLFAIWLIIALKCNKKYISVWKLILGFIFVRFLIFDVSFNISAGQEIFYYGTTKLYDIIMTSLGSWGYFMKLVCGTVGTVFLLGKE